MAYQIKKSSRITEQMEFLGEDNQVVLTIDVDIDADRLSQKYRATEMQLMECREQAEGGSAEGLQAYGTAVLAFFDLVFGEENTQKMLAYFDGNYTDMFLQVTPFIQHVVKPAIEAEILEKRQRMVANMQLSKRQRRRIGL